MAQNWNLTDNGQGLTLDGLGFTGDGRIYTNYTYCDIIISHFFRMVYRSTKVLMVYITKNGWWYIFMFGVFIEATENQMATQNNGRKWEIFPLISINTHIGSSQPQSSHGGTFNQQQKLCYSQVVLTSNIALWCFSLLSSISP